MDISKFETEAAFEAKLNGNLSFSDNASFKALLDDMQQSKANRWVLDLAGLSNVDSAGLGMFIIAMETAKKANVSLTLRSPNGHVKNLIELSNMDKLINVEA